MKLKRTASINSCRLHFDRLNLKRRRCFRKRLYTQVQRISQLVGASYPVGARGRRAQRERLSWPRETKPRKISSVTGEWRIREYESCTQRGVADDTTTTQSAPSDLVFGVPPANHKSDLYGVLWGPMGGQAGNTRKGQFVVRFYLRRDDINFEKRCWPNGLTTRTNEFLKTLVIERVGCDLEFWRLISLKSFLCFLQRDELCHHSFKVVSSE